MLKDNRGRFRRMNALSLQQVAADSFWLEQSFSRGIYAYPLRGNVLFINFLGRIKRLTRGIGKNDLHQEGSFWVTASPDSHLGPFRHALDFLVPDGTVVVAAAEGTVVEVVEGNERWGDSPSFRDQLNYVTLKHDNGEFSQYCHLAKDSVGRAGISVGSFVHRGDRLGMVGKTGWTDRDHLHFIVFELSDQASLKFGSDFGFRSLKVRFTSRGG